MATSGQARQTLACGSVRAAAPNRAASGDEDAVAVTESDGISFTPFGEVTRCQFGPSVFHNVPLAQLA